MDSDSDHFESADENFDSDTEETSRKTQHQETKENEKTHNTHVDSSIPQLKSLKIDEKPDEITQKKTCEAVDESKSNKETHKEEVSKPSEIIETKPVVTEKIEQQEKQTTNSDATTKKPRQIERKERPKMKSKLGIKLGTKIEPNKFVDTVEDTKPDIIRDDLRELQKPQECWEDVVGWAPFENDSKYSQKPELPEKNYWEKEADYMELPQKENFNNVADKMSAGDRAQSSWSDWGNWGVSSILSTASLGVSTLTNSVSQGINTVLETGIGAPDPAELARIDRLDKQKRHSDTSNEFKEREDQKPKQEQPESQRTMAFGLGNFVSGVTHITKLVETTGTKVLSGGLDTLEVIGKKTMEVLQEGDPGFKKKKAFLGIDHDKPVLSQVLREAKEKAEEENKFLEERHLARKANYETLFDDHQGLVHLEALEMLSKQCDIKLENTIESLHGNELTELQETLAQIKELCEIPDEDEDDSHDIETIREKLESAISDLNVNITYDHLISTWVETEEWLQDSAFSEREIHQNAIETLAKLTAISVEQFHKASELLLVKERRSTVDEADSLVQLTTTLTSMIGMAAGKFSEKLNSLAEFSSDPDSVNSLITNIFLEAANSSSYIQDAFQLLIPVLQAGAV